MKRFIISAYQVNRVVEFVEACHLNQFVLKFTYFIKMDGIY